MMKDVRKNPVREKSYAFALRMVHASEFLRKKSEKILSAQLLRSGTSIGSNVQEGIHAQSKREFIAKLQISLKESFETEYWICLLREGKYFTQKQAASLLHDVSELQGLLTAIIKTARSRS